MLDPISAISVAAAVVQFVDFAGSLVASTVRIYRSPREKDEGYSEANLIKTLAKDLRNFNTELASSLEVTTSQQLGKQDQEIVRLCKECNGVANKLLSAMDRLKADNRSPFWNSFLQALRTVWSEAEIEGLRNALDSFRSQISMYILVSLR